MNTSPSSSQRHAPKGEQHAAEIETIKKYSKDWQLEVLALFGFCASGVIFVIAGLRSGDMLTVFGSIVWIISCICWLLPYRKYLS